MRAAGYAAERGRAGAVRARRRRLAFCGGFDLDDPEILAEAAAAAGIGLDECLRAAGDAHRDGDDGGLAARRVVSRGRRTCPALRVGRPAVLRARTAWARRRPPPAAPRPRGARRAGRRALRADEPGEDQLVQRSRVDASSSARRGPRRRTACRRLVEEEVELGGLVKARRDVAS